MIWRATAMSSTESQYLMAMDSRDSYRGKWIAIVDNKVIAKGKALSEVYQEAIKQSGGKTPLFHRIPETDEEQTLLL